jgi:hypothetical protein
MSFYRKIVETELEATGYGPLFHASIARLDAMFVLSDISRR